MCPLTHVFLSPTPTPIPHHGRYCPDFEGLKAPEGASTVLSPTLMLAGQQQLLCFAQNMNNPPADACSAENPQSPHIPILGHCVGSQALLNSLRNILEDDVWPHWAENCPSGLVLCLGSAPPALQANSDGTWILKNWVWSAIPDILECKA